MLFYYFKSLMLVVSLFIIPTFIQAAVILEGTETLAGPNFVLNTTLGQQVGANLFYRFQSLNIESTESITFTNSVEIETIIILVMGEQSNLDGLLKSEIPNANFYFLNPKGITFGPHAKIEVPASLSISTAAYLKLSDGNLFEATTPNTLLTGSSPNAFGFLDTPAPIIIEGSQLVLNDIPKTIDEQISTLSWIAGEITLKNGTLLTSNQDIKLVSLATSGEISVEKMDFTGIFGSIQLENSGISTLTEDNQQSGKITLLTNQLSLIENSLISSFGAGHVSIQANEVQLKSSIISTTSDIILNLNKLKMQNSSVQTLSTLADGGNINIKANEVQLKSSIISTTAEFQGNTGNIMLILNKLNMQNSSVQTLSTLADGGDIIIMTSGPLYLIDSEITTRIEGENSGGGNITILAKFIVLDGGYIIAHAQGEYGGNININTKTNMIYSNCLTLTPELNANLHISCVEVSDTQYQGEFTLIDMANFIFELNPTTLKESNIKGNAPFISCGTFSENVMHLHCIRIDDTFWWADLEWINQNPIQFQLTKQFGLLE